MNTTNTLEVIQTFGNKIDSYIQIAAEKGNQTVEHFWPIIVRQQSINAYSSISFVLFFLTVSLILLFLGHKNLKKQGVIGYNDDKTASLLISGFFILGSVIVTFLVEGSDIASKILNPEYFALQEVIKMIK